MKIRVFKLMERERSYKKAVWRIIYPSPITGDIDMVHAATWNLAMAKVRWLLQFRKAA